MTPDFGRVLTAMISPFTTDDELDVEGAKTLAKWLVEQGNEGLVIAGTTGESPTLTHEEQINLIAAVVADCFFGRGLCTWPSRSCINSIRK